MDGARQGRYPRRWRLFQRGFRRPRSCMAATRSCLRAMDEFEGVLREGMARKRATGCLWLASWSGSLRIPRVYIHNSMIILAITMYFYPVNEDPSHYPSRTCSKIECHVPTRVSSVLNRAFPRNSGTGTTCYLYTPIPCLTRWRRVRSTLIKAHAISTRRLVLLHLEVLRTQPERPQESVPQLHTRPLAQIT